MRMGLNSKSRFFRRTYRVENVRRHCRGCKADELCRPDRDYRIVFLRTGMIARMQNRLLANQAFGKFMRSTSVEECEKRDVKGLYKAALEGKIAQFTRNVAVTL